MNKEHSKFPQYVKSDLLQTCCEIKLLTCKNTKIKGVLLDQPQNNKPKTKYAFRECH